MPSSESTSTGAVPAAHGFDTRAASAWNPDLALLIARILIVAIFPIAGYLKLTGWAGTVGTMERYGLPLPTVAAALATAAELILPVLVILGIWTRQALFGLILFTVVATLLAHRFWEFEGAQWFPQLANFWKNVGLIGGMTVVSAFGPGRYALRP